MKILGIIPSRYASTRFPAKALVDIQGKSMVQRVYEQALKSTLLFKVVVSTDHEKILDHVREFGGNVVMTNINHQSGTDRCKETLDQLNDDYDFVINIQGDEPFIHPEQIDLLASCLEKDTELATLIIKSKKDENIFNPNTVKVVLNSKSEAIYFSRHPIPFIRNYGQDQWTEHFSYYRHIGIYAYRTDILEKITDLKQSPLELAESLEQLRWIENGYKIKVQVTEHESFGIDSPEDLNNILKKISI